MDGKETYKRIRQDKRLNSLPVVVFTSSEKPEDKKMFSSFGVELITKPDNIRRMNDIARHLLSFCP